MPDYTKAVGAALVNAWHQGHLWQPSSLAAVLGLVCAAALLFARAQLRRAKEDWANAYFYSPSTMGTHQQRRLRWQRATWVLLAATLLCLGVAAFLYLSGRG